MTQHDKRTGWCFRLSSCCVCNNSGGHGFIYQGALGSAAEEPGAGASPQLGSACTGVSLLSGLVRHPMFWVHSLMECDRSAGHVPASGPSRQCGRNPSLEITKVKST